MSRQPRAPSHSPSPSQVSTGVTPRALTRAPIVVSLAAIVGCLLVVAAPACTGKERPRDRNGPGEAGAGGAGGARPPSTGKPDHGPLAAGGVGGQTETELDLGMGDDVPPEDDWIGPCAEADARPGTPQMSTHGSSCCGCLCADTRWSCSEETCLDADGLASTVAPEAGFFEIEGGDYTVNGESRTSPAQRIFYSFHPAEEQPTQRPLLVFFNGGPGAPTTAYLFAFNTAPHTLDPEFTGAEVLAVNPNSYARAFNLLYVDAPGTGFSYAPPTTEGQAPDYRLDMNREAAQILRLLLLFLEKHPALEALPIILTGESYGGTRATLMTHLLQHYETLDDPTGEYHDPSLYQALTAHFERVRPELGGQPPTLEEVAQQFGHQVLIEPALLGSLQRDADPNSAPCVGATCASRLETTCVENPEVDQCDMKEGSLEPIFEQVAQRLTQVQTLQAMLGVDPSTIAWLRRCDPAPLTAETQLPFTRLRVMAPYPGALKWSDPEIALTTVPTLFTSRTFLTQAKRDLVIQSMSIVTALDQVFPPPAEVLLHADLPNGAPRPGELHLSLGERETSVRFPAYEAGHTVTIQAAAELYEDLVDWWENP